jgi:hypothetical protein
MTVKDLRIQYCQTAINPPFSELFNLDLDAENNEDGIEDYITYLEEKLLETWNK